jgi:hypothetical protein
MKQDDLAGRSSDEGDRVVDFYTRHGGRAARAATTGETLAGNSGWSEAYAADGYILRCDWSRLGDREELAYSEIRPAMEP